MKKLVLTLSMALSLALVFGLPVLAGDPPDGGSAEVDLEVEVVPPPEEDRDRGGGASFYPIETNLFGVEKTYYTEYDGDLQDEISGTSQDSNLTITIPDGTTALDQDGKRLEDLSITVNEDPPALPENSSVIGLAYNFEPAGATFNPPITLTWTYDPEDFPGDVANLVLAYYGEETSEWIELPCIVDPVTCTITASVDHFTTFAIIGFIPPMPPLPEPEKPEVIEPEEPTEPLVEPEEPTEEPEDPEVEEPYFLIEEPIVEEPEVEEPELIVEEPSQWNWLNILLACLVAIMLGLDIWQWRRKKSNED